jgi:UDP-N-acetylglucosamine 2-epimerase (non-hydrolysing)
MNDRKKRVLCVYGTRPEIIKMSPVINDLKLESWVDLSVASTGQHRELLSQAQKIFQIKPDYELKVMQNNQSLATSSSRILQGIDEILTLVSPDAVLIQGDTTTVAMTALACFYRQIDFGHIEAGLRTNDMDNPFPEEFNRIIASRLAKWHFAPTAWAKNNLLSEGIQESRIWVTGNTGIDSLLRTSDSSLEIPEKFRITGKMVLITVHRRENFGTPIQNICKAIEILSSLFREVTFLIPIHPNPNVKEVIISKLSSIQNIVLCEPLDYQTFAFVLRRAHFVVTDSGGVQEEAPAFGKPVLILRDETERPEGVEFGVSKLIGTFTEDIVQSVSELLTNHKLYDSMSRTRSPYGDGKASQRIIAVLRDQIKS